MSGEIETEVPAREDAGSPTEDGKDGQHFRLLIVANRLPITIKKQPDVLPSLKSVLMIGWIQV